MDSGKKRNLQIAQCFFEKNDISYKCIYIRDNRTSVAQKGTPAGIADAPEGHLMGMVIGVVSVVVRE